ncbi:unnamed protein product [Cochlearia groenlandica]
MAISCSFSLPLILLFVVLVQWTHEVCSESTISASPAVLPYINAPYMSSFFPSPSKNQPFDTAISPVPEVDAPGPSSDQLAGKITGGSMQLCPHLSLVLVIVWIFSFVSLLC